MRDAKLWQCVSDVLLLPAAAVPAVPQGATPYEPLEEPSPAPLAPAKDELPLPLVEEDLRKPVAPLLPTLLVPTELRHPRLLVLRSVVVFPAALPAAAPALVTASLRAI